MRELDPKITTFGAHPIYFLTSGAARGYIDNVGLKIDNTAAADFLLTLKNNSTSGYSAFNALDSAGTKQAHFGWANSAAALGPSSTHISTGGPLRFYYQTGASSTELGYFSPVGSGSWTWLAKTTVVSSETADFNHPLNLQNTGTNGSTTINFINSAGTAKAVMGYQATCITGCSDAFGATSLTMRTKSTDPITFWTNNTERMRIDGSSATITVSANIVPPSSGGATIGTNLLPFGISYFTKINATNSTGVGSAGYFQGGPSYSLYANAGDGGAPAFQTGGDIKAGGHYTFTSDALFGIGSLTSRASEVWSASHYATGAFYAVSLSGAVRSVVSASGFITYDGSGVETASISRLTGEVRGRLFTFNGNAGKTVTITVSGCTMTFNEGGLTANSGTC